MQGLKVVINISGAANNLVRQNTNSTFYMSFLVLAFLTAIFFKINHFQKLLCLLRNLGNAEATFAVHLIWTSMRPQHHLILHRQVAADLYIQLRQRFHLVNMAWVQLIKIVLKYAFNTVLLQVNHRRSQSISHLLDGFIHDRIFELETETQLLQDGFARLYELVNLLLRLLGSKS